VSLRVRIVLFTASFWALFGLVSGAQVWISMLSHGHSVPRLLGYHLLVWQGWTVATALIARLALRWPLIPYRRMNLLIHFLAACLIGIAHSFYWSALMIAMRPYDRMQAEPSGAMISSGLFARLPVEWTLYCLVIGAVLAFSYYNRYRERELEAARLQTSLADARLQALELQIQPHFLFNTMNSISALIRARRNDEAIEMTAGLCELLRYSLDHEGKQQVALEDEVAVLRRYLEIQHVRFSDRMTYEVDVAADAGRGAIPTLLLQPLAENAVRHGIAMSAAAGVIEVRATRHGDRLQIDVFNSGSFAGEARDGIGLRNTRARLQHLYGDAGKFELVAADGGVLARVTIPWSELP
jgi:hypothetical protein